MEHMITVNTRRIPKTVLTNKRKKLNWTCNEELGGEYDTVTGHLYKHLTGGGGGGDSKKKNTTKEMKTK
jgi:hypothetical protein